MKNFTTIERDGLVWELHPTRADVDGDGNLKQIEDVAVPVANSLEDLALLVERKILTEKEVVYLVMSKLAIKLQARARAKAEAAGFTRKDEDHYGNLLTEDEVLSTYKHPTLKPSEARRELCKAKWLADKKREVATRLPTTAEVLQKGRE